MDITIREYRKEDHDEWMRVHAIILSISHAWNYSIQERPDYKGHDSTRLVAEADGRIAGLIDAKYEKESGEFCFLKDSPGGYVLEFGRLPEYSGHNIGKLLMDACAADAKSKGFHRLEYWTQDRKAQRFYRRIGLKEISRHYRFRMKAPEDLQQRMMQEEHFGVEYLYCACMPEEWPLIRKKFDVIEDHPLEPHLCAGFEIRF
jgi:ribosomal protein S18 acetylase RimI-like enzyme